jgi:hypothetical protein
MLMSFGAIAASFARLAVGGINTELRGVEQERA